MQAGKTAAFPLPPKTLYGAVRFRFLAKSRIH
jgi:hypothetical protein